MATEQGSGCPRRYRLSVDHFERCLCISSLRFQNQGRQFQMSSRVHRTKGCSIVTHGSFEKDACGPGLVEAGGSRLKPGHCRAARASAHEPRIGCNPKPATRGSSWFKRISHWRCGPVGIMYGTPSPALLTVAMQLPRHNDSKPLRRRLNVESASPALPMFTQIGSIMRNSPTGQPSVLQLSRFFITVQALKRSYVASN